MAGTFRSDSLIRSKTEFDLLTIYASTIRTNRRDFFKKVSGLMTSERNCIICGDFNCVINSSKDRKSKARLNQRSSDTKALQDVVAKLNLKHIYRKQHSDTPGYTWTRAHARTAARLDMFLVSSTPQTYVKSTSVLSSAFSDHFGVSMRINVQMGKSYGRGYWKFNSTLLTEKSFRRRIASDLLVSLEILERTIFFLE